MGAKITLELDRISGAKLGDIIDPAWAKGLVRIGPCLDVELAAQQLKSLGIRWDIRDEAKRAMRGKTSIIDRDYPMARVGDVVLVIEKDPKDAHSCRFFRVLYRKEAFEKEA